MKNLFKILAVTLISIFTMSFLSIKNSNVKNNIKKLSGKKQVFINSTKKITDADKTDFTKSFEHKQKIEKQLGFEFYEFNFDVDSLFHLYIKDDKTYREKIKINLIKSDSEFALFSYEDTSKYYNSITSKLLVVNLKNNPDYPELQILWEQDKKFNGVYSVDTRTVFEVTFPIVEDVEIFKK